MWPRMGSGLRTPGHLQLLARTGDRRSGLEPLRLRTDGARFVQPNPPSDPDCALGEIIAAPTVDQYPRALICGLLPRADTDGHHHAASRMGSAASQEEQRGERVGPVPSVTPGPEALRAHVLGET